MSGMIAGMNVILKIQLPASERGRSASDIQRIDRLKRKLSRKDLRKTQREEAERELANLLNAPQLAADRAWQERSAAETAALAEGRGEEVSRSKSGAIRVNSRDALLSLVRAGHLTAAQYDAGVTCREAYEARSGDAGSQMGSFGAGAAHNNDRYVFTRLQRAKALQRISTIERAVASSCMDEDGRRDPNGLAMLRAVCGDGKSLSSQGEGRAFERNAKSLAAALDIAAVITGHARQA